MLVEISTPQNSVVFHQDINDIDSDGYAIYLGAHKVWGEEGWHTLEVKHKGEVIANMLNSSTMIPKIVE
jgi:hypothetical protein